MKIDLPIVTQKYSAELGFLYLFWCYDATGSLLLPSPLVTNINNWLYKGIIAAGINYLLSIYREPEQRIVLIRKIIVK